MTRVRVLRAATRASPLARWQTDHVAALLTSAHPDLAVEALAMVSAPDMQLDVPLWQIGGKGAFAKEVQRAVLAGDADIAVHSAKDLPSVPTEGLVIACIPSRGDARDALVGTSLAELRPGAVVATGSARRRVQLSDVRPDLTFVGLRGTMQTRLDKIAEVDAGVVAAVALERLGLADQITEILDPAVMIPQVAQGALAVECRADDEATIELLQSIDDPVTRRCLDAERAYLATLGGDCDLPAGAHAVPTADGRIHLTALLATLDGSVVTRTSATAADATLLGAELAHRLAPLRRR